MEGTNRVFVLMHRYPEKKLLAGKEQKVVAYKRSKCQKKSHDPVLC